MAEQNATETASTRQRIATRNYRLPEGKTSRSASADATGLEFVWADKRPVSVYTLADLPESIRTALAWHGLSQKLGDGFASAKGDIDTAEETSDALYENLKNGTFVERAEGVGPAPTMVAEAIAEALRAKGETVDEARFNTIVEKVKDKATREGALKDPAIAASYAAIRAKRAAEKAAKAAEAAKGATIGIDGF